MTVSWWSRRSGHAQTRPRETPERRNTPKNRRHADGRAPIAGQDPRPPPPKARGFHVLRDRAGSQTGGDRGQAVKPSHSPPTRANRAPRIASTAGAGNPAPVWARRRTASGCYTFHSVAPGLTGREAEPTAQAPGSQAPLPQEDPDTPVSSKGEFGMSRAPKTTGPDSTSALRANPCSEVTDPICRLPLPTLVYRLEALHLGDRLRIWVRARSVVLRGPHADFHGPSGHPRHRRKCGALPALFPLSPQWNSRELAR